MALAAGEAAARTVQEINAEVNACTDRFYNQVPDGRNVAAKARGILVVPNVYRAGFIVGGEYGRHLPEGSQAHHPHAQVIIF
jgi:lipid-binding SYLF domain-containing protein